MQDPYWRTVRRGQYSGEDCSQPGPAVSQARHSLKNCCTGSNSPDPGLDICNTESIKFTSWF
uniref:Uncharacterized protein n=1 Tax=Xenopus tropicalis TaxID=8364 RepID=A0A1B8Y9U9_XENTR